MTDPIDSHLSETNTLGLNQQLLLRNMGEAEGVIYFPGSTPQDSGSLNPKGVDCHTVIIWTNTQEKDVSVKRCKESECLDHNSVPTAPSQTPFAGRASSVGLRHSRCHRSDANC